MALNWSDASPQEPDDEVEEMAEMAFDVVVERESHRNTLLSDFTKIEGKLWRQLFDQP